MLGDKSSRDFDNVTGLTYREAESVMQQIEYAIRERVNNGFGTREQCAEFAKAHHLDLMVYMRALGNFRNVSHRGDTLTASDWKRMYRQILYYPIVDDEGKTKRVQWTNENYDSFSTARLYGEQSDGKYPPLYHRNYFTPTGHFDDASGTFNVARPITTFAKNTGADTGFIHTLLRHIGGECYPHLLSWLRSKVLWPTRKTEVVPIFVGGQGTGKTTFGEVLCKALFGEENVLVTDQFDSTARFNADNADALVICIEEKTQEDRKNTSSSLKSRATATKVRKENKGVDPFYQDSYTDFVLTTNEAVPLKFEDRGNQRRFMVMEVDKDFARANENTTDFAKAALADEVFTKLYGYTADGEKVCDGLIENRAVIEQFKQELYDQVGAEGVNYRNFPKTAAYKRCFEIPRTNENINIEIIIKALSPFIKESLIQRKLVTEIKIIDEDTKEEKSLYLNSLLQEINSIQFVKRNNNKTDRIALCRQVIFCDQMTGKEFPHSVVERVLLDMRQWLQDEHGLILLNDTEHPSNGFKNLTSKVRYSPTTWIALAGAKTKQEEIDELKAIEDEMLLEVAYAKGDDNEFDFSDNDGGAASYGDTAIHSGSSAAVGVKALEVAPVRSGQRVRYNDRFVYDPDGEFETLNELKEGTVDRRKENAQYLDTFLLESDNATSLMLAAEVAEIKKALHYGKVIIPSETLYAKRLALQDIEADRLFNAGAVCRVIYSGMKSIHLLVRVADSPDTLEEREWLDAYLKSTLSDKVFFDKSTKDPTRLTRAPVNKQRSKVLDLDEYGEMLKGIIFPPDGMIVSGTQRLLAENWNNVYRLNWRPIYDVWKNQPPAFYERRGRMMPSKPIYKEGAIALVETKDFFSAQRWTGQRQDVFFPAYRLCRSMGYTHDELWEIIVPQIEEYRKVKERTYWRTRQHSDIIRSIDGEFDDC